MTHQFWNFPLAVCFVIGCLSVSVHAQGVLNPEEMTLRMQLQKARQGRVDNLVCSQAYFISKSGDHGDAKEIFLKCAEAGFTAAMIWLAHLEANGMGGPPDPSAAAAWDRRAAEAGDPLGAYNYGLDLLRGFGVEKNRAEGIRYIDIAVRHDVDGARALQAADYDPDAATPDSDQHYYP